MAVFTLNDEVDSLVAGDLMRARQFLRALETTGKSRQTKIIREALTLASIVSYCRPFMTNFDASGRKRRWIPGRLLKDLPPRLRSVHKRIVAARNQAWAHTDWSEHSPTALAGGGVVSRNPWIPLDEPEVAEFATLVGEVLARLQPRSAVSASSGEAELSLSRDARKNRAAAAATSFRTRAITGASRSHLAPKAL
jgi:hypothetical protein